jgi:hypothetical protein
MNHDEIDNTCPNCKQTAGIGIEVKHLDTCPHNTGDHDKIKEYGHVCSECSVYLPGSMSRQLCENNQRMNPAWRAEKITISNQALLIELKSSLDEHINSDLQVKALRHDVEGLRQDVLTLAKGVKGICKTLNGDRET